MNIESNKKTTFSLIIIIISHTCCLILIILKVRDLNTAFHYESLYNEAKSYIVIHRINLHENH